MNARLVRFAVLLAVLGCTGDDDTDFLDLASDRLPVGDDDDDDDTHPSDSSVLDDGPFEPYYLQVDATFGWDNEARKLVNVRTDYGEIPPAIAISLGDRSWGRDDFSAESEGYCLIVLPLTDPTPVPNWVMFDPSLYFGFDYSRSDRPLSDCGTEDYAYPEDWNGTPEEWSELGWGVAIGELPSEYAENFATSILLPHLVGAQINNQLIYTSENEGVVGYVAVASEIDVGYNLVVEADGRQPLRGSGDVPVPGGGMATGLYQIMPLYIFTFSQSP